MIDQILKSIEQSFDSENYFAGLSALLILIDTCGKAEYPNEQSTKKRFINWFDQYVGENYEHKELKLSDLKCEHDLTQTDVDQYNHHMQGNNITGNVIYSLRRNMIHQGTPGIDATSDGSYHIDDFSIYIPIKNDFNIYTDSVGLSTDNDGNITRHYRLNLMRLKVNVCDAVKKYYENNKSKFDFFKYKIIKEADYAFLKEKQDV